MRKQFVSTIENIMATDERLTLLLGDIGVFSFRNAFELYPKRIYNIGICEQAMTSLAAGLASEGFVPVIHSIAPFVVERCYEQIKIDFIYHGLGGNIVSVGASYDYAGLGYTHQCPGDVSVLRTLPGMEIVLPGTRDEFDSLFRSYYDNGHLTYFRLSEQYNDRSNIAYPGKGYVIKRGNLATVLAVGPTLDRVVSASEVLDVTVLYYNCVVPFDSETLANNCPSGKILLVEPYSSGVLCADVHRAMGPRSIAIKMVGVPGIIVDHYGDIGAYDQTVGLTAEYIKHQLEELIDGL